MVTPAAPRHEGECTSVVPNGGTDFAEATVDPDAKMVDQRRVKMSLACTLVNPSGDMRKPTETAVGSSWYSEFLLCECSV